MSTVQSIMKLLQANKLKKEHIASLDKAMKAYPGYVKSLVKKGRRVKAEQMEDDIHNF